MSTIFLSIDPGKDKSGLAVMDKNSSVIEKKVIATINFKKEISDYCKKYSFKKILIGNSKKGKELQTAIIASGIKPEIILVDEANSTLEARKLYWKENIPKGLLRLIPESLRLPPDPYDDYSAIVIGNRYLKGFPQ